MTYEQPERQSRGRPRLPLSQRQGFLRALVLLFIALYTVFLVMLSNDSERPARSVFGRTSPNGAGGGRKSGGWCQSELGTKGGNCVDAMTPHVGEEWRLVTAVLSCGATQRIATHSDTTTSTSSGVNDRLVASVPMSDVLLLQASWCAATQPNTTKQEDISAEMLPSEQTRICLAIYELFKRSGRWSQIRFTELQSSSSNLMAKNLACNGDYEDMLQLPADQRQRGFEMYAASHVATEHVQSFDEDNRRLFVRFRAAATRFSETVSLVTIARNREPHFPAVSSSDPNGGESLRGVVVPLARFLDATLLPDATGLLWRRCNGSSLVLQHRVKAALEASTGMQLVNPMPVVSNLMFNAENFIVLPFPIHQGSTVRQFRNELFDVKNDERDREDTTMTEADQLREILHDLSGKNLAPTLALFPCSSDADDEASAALSSSWRRVGSEIDWWAIPFSALLSGASIHDNSNLIGRRTLLACIPGAFSSPERSTPDVKIQAFSLHPSSLDAEISWWMNI
ncbi:membrane-associated protein, putative [Bodo saltans]|uniref:Membrane-associated protein, putative n=1 Tax=Bodo saltans TaxID=75058 RepID=A0A0S4JHI3_BODSA|nr:membrane-associated protein, putative [Bodo saltans]|eukprot:CUG88478.1 membrane-associated protein, putative [Bodo saltans]